MHFEWIYPRRSHNIKPVGVLKRTNLTFPSLPSINSPTLANGHSSRIESYFSTITISPIRGLCWFFFFFCRNICPKYSFRKLLLKSSLMVDSSSYVKHDFLRTFTKRSTFPPSTPPWRGRWIELPGNSFGSIMLWNFGPVHWWKCISNSHKSTTAIGVNCSRSSSSRNKPSKSLKEGLSW